MSWIFELALILVLWSVATGLHNIARAILLVYNDHKKQKEKS